MNPRRLRFYSLPPRKLRWPFIFVNASTYQELRGRQFLHAILDPAVERFLHNPNLKDYPPSFLFRYRQRAEILTHQTQGRLWVTIPDYPDDYHPRQFGDNVSKTLKNIEHFLSIEKVNWLPVIQARYLDIFSFHESCQRTREIIGDYPRVAIGTVCKTNKLSFIEGCCKVARKFFPNSHIHAFGLTLKAIPKVATLIDSFDSMAWTFPRNKFREWSIKTGLKPFPNPHWSYDSEACIPYFHAYVERLRQFVELEGPPKMEGGI